MEYRELQPTPQLRTRNVTRTQVITFDFSKVKELIHEWKLKGDRYLLEFISGLSDDSLVSLESIVCRFPRKLVPNVLFNSIISEKRLRVEERNNELLINKWATIKKELGLSISLSKVELLREATQFKLLTNSLCRIPRVTDMSVWGYMNALPHSFIEGLGSLMSFSSLCYSGPRDDVNSIMRWYILKSSKSFFAPDVVTAAIVYALKKMLDVATLPIPSVTTVYLVYIWGALINDLSYHYFGDELSISRIIAVAIALVAMLLQYLNRESILKFVKAMYTTPYMVADLCRKIPPDIKMVVQNIVGKEINEYSSGVALTNIFNGWNHTLSELTGVENLTMNKSLDMLYTYRIGRTFVDYCQSRKGLEFSSLISCWNSYGPLPNREQVEGLLKLFREQCDVYESKVNKIYNEHFNNLTRYSDYNSVLTECVAIYRDMSKLNESYHPSTIEWTELFEIRHKCDHTLIYLLAGQVKERLSLQKDVRMATQKKIASDIFHQIYHI